MSAYELQPDGTLKEVDLKRADLVAVVRCRDCKHVSPDGRWCYSPLGCSDAEELPVKPDSFCAWGERK